jgi:ABC-type Fe3+-siderophore transport system permease subunit
LDFCFNYDPDTNKGLFQKVKIAVLVIFATIIASVFFYLGRRKKRKK